MHDITISKKNIKKELTIWLLLFILSFCFNIYAIVKYKSGWIELLSQIHIVIILSILFYVFIGVVRIIFFITNKIFKK